MKPVPSIKRSSDFSKTQKNTNKINMLLKTLQEMDDEDASNLGTFNPPPKPLSSGVNKTTDVVDNPMSNVAEHNQPIKAVTSTQPGLELNNLKYTYPEPSNVETYYRKYLPSYPHGTSEGYSNKGSDSKDSSKQAIPIPSNTDHVEGHYRGYVDKTLTDKINYMIHLLEDKQDVKSNSRMEELGLYCLLGIFTIFLVDSFSRVGKYVR